MKKTILSLFLVAVATGLFARSFDGTQKIYLKANAVSWWTDANAAQRAVLDNTTPVIGVIEDADRKIYAFTIPAGDYTTIRFERAETAEAAAWNATGEITIPAEGNYVTSFSQGSSDATWDTYSSGAPVEYTTHHITVTNNTTWTGFHVYAWGDSQAFGDWPGSSATSLDFQAADGVVTLHLIFHQDDGEANRQLFEITEARDYNIIVTDDAAYEQGSPEPVVNTYHVYVSNLTTWEVFDLYSWGTPNDAFGAWPGTTTPATATVDGIQCYDYTFKVAEGGTVEMHLIFHNNVGEGVEGDMRQLYDITEARDYKLTVHDSEIKEGLEGTPSVIEHNTVEAKAVKRIVNGQLLIIRDGKTYNVVGTVVR